MLGNNSDSAIQDGTHRASTVAANEVIFKCLLRQLSVWVPSSSCFSDTEAVKSKFKPLARRYH